MFNCMLYFYYMEVGVNINKTWYHDAGESAVIETRENLVNQLTKYSINTLSLKWNF